MIEGITKEKKPGGTIYRIDGGEELQVYHESLDNIFHSEMSKIESILNSASRAFEHGYRGDGFNLISAGESVIVDAKRKFNDLSDFMDSDFGRVEVVRASYRQDFKPETMIDVEFTPTEEKAPETETS